MSIPIPRLLYLKDIYGHFFEESISDGICTTFQFLFHIHYFNHSCYCHIAHKEVRQLAYADI